MRGRRQWRWMVRADFVCLAVQFSGLWSDTNGRFLGADGPMPTCPAGAACGGSLLPVGGGGSKPPPYAHGVAPYFQLYGTGQFDGQSSGHDFMGTVFLPSTGESRNLVRSASAVTTYGTELPLSLLCASGMRSQTQHFTVPRVVILVQTQC